MTSSRSDVRARLGRRVRRLAPRARRQSRAARRWAIEQAAALPSHTHAARLAGLVTPPPPGLPRWTGGEVVAALDASPATCLQRCLVLQAWLAAHGRPLDVAIGFRAQDGFEAHAWIPGFHGPGEQQDYREMARVPAGGGLRASTG